MLTFLYVSYLVLHCVALSICTRTCPLCDVPVSLTITGVLSITSAWVLPHDCAFGAHQHVPHRPKEEIGAQERAEEVSGALLDSTKVIMMTQIEALVK